MREQKDHSDIRPDRNHKSTTDQIIWWSVSNITSTESDNCLTRRSVGWLTALTSVRKKPHFHTRHIKEQNKHDTIESDLLNLSNPHRWPLLWLMRSVAHECLRFCSAWLMVTFGFRGARSKSVPHTQWPAAGALTMARPTVDTHTSSCGWPSWPLLRLPWNWKLSGPLLVTNHYLCVPATFWGREQAHGGKNIFLMGLEGWPCHPYPSKYWPHRDGLKVWPEVDSF